MKCYSNQKQKNLKTKQGPKQRKTAWISVS